MMIRNKLLVLLLALALAPLLISSWLDSRAVRDLGERLAQQGADQAIALTRANLEQLADDYARLTKAQKARVETTVLAQAAYARLLATLAQPRGLNGTRHADALDADGGLTPRPGGVAVNFEHAALFDELVPGPARVTLAQRYGALGEAMRHLAGDNDFVYWQYAAFETGLHLVYPGHGDVPENYDPRLRPWYRHGLATPGLSWARPHADATTGQTMLTATHEVTGPDGETIGVTAVDVPVGRIVEALSLPEGLRAGAEFVLVAERRQARPEWFVLARREAGATTKAWNEPITLPTLAPDGPDGPKLVAAMSRAGDGTIRASHAGVDTFWVHRRLDDDTLLVLLVPVALAVAPALEAADMAAATTGRQLAELGRVAGIAVLAVFAIALVASRSVVRPLTELEAAVRRIARGDFDARVHVATSDEIGRLGVAFNRMVPRLAAFTQMSRSMALAREVQQKLLPQSAPARPRLDIAGRSVYCDQTGGDYFDFLAQDHIRNGLTTVAIGDVAGHGIPSALLMATVRALLHGVSDDDLRPAAMLDAINGHLVKDTHGGRFMTLFLAQADIEADTLTYASAGHDAALLYEPGVATFVELDGADIPLGIEAGWRFSDTVRTLPARGAIIVLGTDGLWEMRNDRGEFFGKDRLQKTVAANAEQDAHRICAGVFAALEEFRGEAPQRDDVTLIVVRIV